MVEPSNSRAGGAIVALCVVAGATIGVVFRQVSIGILAGTAVGTAIAVLIWLQDRRRTR